MKEHDREGLRVFTFGSLDEAGGVHAFVTSRHGGESTGDFASLNLGVRTSDDPDVVARNRARVAALAGGALVFGGQVHGLRIETVPESYPGPAFENTDALVTGARATPLTILTADCAAIFFFDPHRRAVGIAHAGWRGTVADMGGIMVARMLEVFGSESAHLIVAIGPSIGPCCYEVGDEVIDAFSTREPEIAEEVLADPDFASAGSFRASANQGKKYLDLWRANELMLARAGVHEERIECARMCTACRTDLFYSHRAERGGTGRFAGVIALR